MKSAKNIRWLTVLVCLLSLATIGCGNRDRSQIVGSWVSTTKDNAKRQDTVTDISGGATEVHFESDGTLRTKTQISEKQGTWQFISADNDGQVIYLSCELQDNKFQTKITILDADTIKMIPPNLFAIQDQIDEIEFKRKTGSQ